MTDPRTHGSIALLAISMLLAGSAVLPARSESTGSVTPKQSAAKQGDQAQCNPATFRMVLDVGHVAEVNFGAISARGAHEYDFNLRLAKVIQKDLISAGFSKITLQIITDHRHRALFQRAKKANKIPADLFLSIHHDSVPDSLLEKWEHEGEERGFSDRFKGHSIFVSINNGNYQGSLQFAQMLGNQMRARGLKYTPHYTDKIMGDRQRILVDPEAGVYRYDQLIVLKDTKMPAALLEAGSIINRDEELILASPERQGLISASVVDAVKAFCAARAKPAAPAPAPAAAPKATAPAPKAAAPGAKARSSLPWPFSKQ
jgi:N-acetylmuramoyl-L-alanine amidase